MPLVIFETSVQSSGGLYQLYYMSSGGLYQSYYRSLGKITRMAKEPSEHTVVSHMELSYSFTYISLFRVHGELKELIMLLSAQLHACEYCQASGNLDKYPTGVCCRLKCIRELSLAVGHTLEI